MADAAHDEEAREAPEACARRVALELKRRYGDADPEELDEDPDFAEAVAALAAPEVELRVVASVAAESSPFVAAIGLRALAARGEAPRDWERRALRSLRRADSSGIAFLLDALAVTAKRPVLAAVLPIVDHDWPVEPAREAFLRFVERRLSAGDTVSADDLDELGEEEFSELERLLEGAEDRLAPLASAVEEHRTARVDRAFFLGFGREVDARTRLSATPVAGRERAIELAAGALAARRSIVLVGEQGVGKTTVLLDALRLLGEGWFVFTAGAADVIAGQTFTGQLEGRIQEIASQMQGRRVVWLFPRLDDAFWAGQWSRGPRGVLDALLPYLERGQIVLAAEVEPAGYELLVRMRPQVATALEAVRLATPTRDETLAIARQWLSAADAPRISETTLQEAQELATAFAAGVGEPANLLRLLVSAVERARESGAPEIGPRDLFATLAETTGLPMRVLDPETPLRVEDVRAFLSERVLGQPEAVECLVERVAMVKAGLTDPTRPLGVFLFVGPTGTGKTELAKALAEFLFGSRERLVRLDMSELQTPDALERLLAADPAAPQGSPLLPAVRRDPFSVVLLDEFEKAHPNIWNLFLQLFDDGRLTDQAGRTASFRQCVLILTSNLGSAIPADAALGFAGSRGSFSPRAVERAVTRSFRPELLNRLDRVVVFRPLDRDVMRSILRHELAAILQRRGFRSRPWAVEWDESAIEFLLERGFSAELGARPLKRAIEQHVLAPLATTIVEHRFPQGDQFLFIGARPGERIVVSFIDPDADERPPKRPTRRGEQPPRLEDLVADPRGEPEEAALLEERLTRVEEREGPWLSRKAELLELMRTQGFWEQPDRHRTLALVEHLDRLEAATRTAEGLLERLAQRAQRHAPPPARIVGLLAERIYLLEHALSDLESDAPPEAVLRIAADGDDGASFAGDLLAMYQQWSERRGMRMHEASAEPEAAFVVTGLGAHSILSREAGLHVFEVPAGERSHRRVVVRVTVAGMPAADPAQDIEARASDVLGTTTAPAAIVRRYRREPSPLVRDSVRGTRSGRLDRVLAGEFDVVL